MNKRMNRVISLILCLTLCMGLMMPVSAAEVTGVSIVLDKEKVETTGEKQTITANVELDIADAETVSAAGMSLQLSLPENWTLEGYALPSGTSGNATATGATWFLFGGTTEVKNLVTLTLGVPADVAVGEYTIAVSAVKVNDATNTSFFEHGAASVTVIVAEPVEPAGPFEVYYTLNETDTDHDSLGEYGVGETVTATVWLKNNTDADLILQAYDVYLTHSAALKFSAVEGNVVAYNGSAVATAADGVVTHIQFVGDKDKQQALGSGAAVELGQISFTIDSAAAVYGQALNITLVQADDITANVDKQAQVTNFSVGTVASGDKNSYYPAVAGEVDGVEVDTQWTITWNNDDDTLLKTTTVGHGLMPDYGTENPTKASDGQYTYTFGGWDPAVVVATGDATYTATYTTATRSYTVTWMNGETVLGTDTVPYGEVPVYDGDEPTKDATDLITYVFAGWDPEVSEVTGDVVYTAVFTEVPREYKITFDLQEGTLADGVANPLPYTYKDTTALPTATKEGFIFNGWKLEETVGGWTADTYPAGTTKVTDKWGDVTLVAQWTEIPKYLVNFEAANGAISASPVGGEVGTEIVLTVVPDEGYELVSISAEDANGDPVALTKTPQGQYTFDMPAANVTVTATFKLTEYTVTVLTVSNGKLTVDTTTATMGTVVTMTATPDPGYEVTSYTVTGANNTLIAVSGGKFTMPASNVTVTASFGLADLALTVTEDTDKGTVTAPETAKMDETVTLKAEAVEGYILAGYTVTYTDANGLQTINVGTDGKFTMPAYPVTVTALWDAEVYSVTLHLNGGTLAAGNEVTEYTYGVGVALPTADKLAKSGYVFGGWYANEDFSGTPATIITATDIGDKEFYAKWNLAANTVIEEYTYAAEGYVLLRVTDNLDIAREYQFDGVSMYWTDDENYLINENDNGVFYLLVPEDRAVDGALTIETIETAEGVEPKRATIDYSGDINGDGVLNIADANIVYQMVINGGKYYSGTNALTIEQRLMADMNKAIDETSDDHRCSTMDVNWIVNLINGVPNEPNA